MMQKIKKKYLEWFAKKFNIQKLEDWYQISTKDFIKNGGIGILTYYGGSLYLILKKIYPEYDWKPWLLNNTPRSFWNKKDSIPNYIKWLENQLNIKTLDDWYNISSKDISLYFEGSGLLKKYGGLKSFLLHYYPNHKWNLELLENNSRLISKSQYRLTQLIQEIFPNQTIEINYKHPLLFNEENNKGKMELDIYLPSLNLAFEYQGEQHYFYHFLYGSNFKVQKRDENKVEICKKLGITLIHIPYWWDRNILSSKSTIHKI
jgi:hypothetical protein